MTKRTKGEPGPYLPMEDVEDLLKAPAYGAIDLVDLGLFHSEHFVRDAIKSGQLKFHKVNTKNIVIGKHELLEYWHKFRNKPYEAANNVLNVRLTIGEVDYLRGLVAHGRAKFNRDVCENDIIRNVLNYMKQRSINFPDLFNKN